MNFIYTAIINEYGNSTIPMRLLAHKRRTKYTKTWTTEPFKCRGMLCYRIENANTHEKTPQKGYIFVRDLGKYIHISELPPITFVGAEP